MTPENAREIAKDLVAAAHYGVMTNEQLEARITEALLSAARSQPEISDEIVERATAAYLERNFDECDAGGLHLCPADVCECRASMRRALVASGLRLPGRG